MLLLFTLVGIWATVNVLFRLKALLGNTRGQLKSNSTTAMEFELVSPLHVRMTVNTTESTWIQQWSESNDGQQTLLRRLVRVFYNLGVIVAIISMLLCLAFLSVAGIQIAVAMAGKLGLGTNQQLGLMWDPLSVWVSRQFGMAMNNTSHGPNHHASHIPSDQSNRSAGSLERRLLDTTDKQQPWLQPVIPGVTMPMSHLWYYLISLAVCAVIHELGHAAAAIREGIRMQSFGAFVIALYPGAFVDLPKDQLEKTSIGGQLRVICAGVWHNAVVALVAWLLVSSGGLGWWFGKTGWQRSETGVFVVDVSSSSPLYGRLPLLSTVYQIDDVLLQKKDAQSGNATTEDARSIRFGESPIARWTSVLTATNSNSDTYTAGYCVGVATNADDGLCCEISAKYPLGESPDGDIFCFERYHSLRPYPAMCYDLRNVFGSEQRCQQDTDCQIANGRGEKTQHVYGRKWSASHQMCVIPSSPFPSSRVLRIHYYPPGDGKASEMLIYAGSPKSLWLEVQVSSLKPRWGWLPYQLPSWTETLFQYILSFSLAFCLLNAIPAWYLDGDHLLKLMFLATERSLARQQARALESTEEDDDGLAAAGNELANIWYQRSYRVITLLTTVLLGWCIVGSLLLVAW